jgi:hypothetical protein
MEHNRKDTYTSDATLDTIKQEMRAQVRPAQKLGAYLKGVMLNRQWTLENLSQKLGHETTLFVRALLNGQMPDEAIGDDFIEDLAQVIERSPNVIRVIMGRKPKQGTRLYTLLDEQAAQSDAMIETLLKVLPNRYTNYIEGDIRKSKQYDFVIKQLEKFIARQKRELDEARRLVEQLQQDNPDEAMKLDLRRIIQRIVEGDPEFEIHERESLRPQDKPAKNGKR